MDDRKLEIIKQLMAELESEMQLSGDDMGERLGRPKAEVAIEIENPEMGDEGEMLEEGPEDKLKTRLLNMRG